MDKFNILIVDDNNQNRQVIASILHEVDDYNLTLAADGKTALEYIQKNTPDLILLDVMMPGIDGFEVAGRLKTDERTSTILPPYRIFQGLLKHLIQVLLIISPNLSENWNY